jgi:hypothetical protein
MMSMIRFWYISAIIRIGKDVISVSIPLFTRKCEDEQIQNVLSRINQGCGRRMAFELIKNQSGVKFKYILLFNSYTHTWGRK